MAENAQKYKRLPGKKIGIFDIHFLRLGEDHLLSVHSIRFQEDYKRFYFNDIQAFIIRKTRTGAVINLILGLAELLLLIRAFYAWRDDSIWIDGVIYAVILVLIGINCVLGPTCVCHIQTSAQTEKLPSLRRIRTVHKFMNRILPHIEQVQGIMGPELPAVTAGFAEKSAKLGTDKALKQESGTFHSLLFFLLLASGCLTLADMLSESLMITLLLTLVSWSGIIVMILALVRQHGSDMGRGVQNTVWCVMVYMIIEIVTGYIVHFSVLLGARAKVHAVAQWEIIKALAVLKPLETPWLAWIYIFSVCGSLILGTVGMLLLRIWQKQDRHSPGNENFHV